MSKKTQVNRNTSGLKPFRPGQSGNPSGRSKLVLTKQEVDKVMGKFAHMDKDELVGILNDKKAPMLEAMIASVMVRAVTDGDASRLEFLFSRSIGKPRIVEDMQDAEGEDIPLFPLQSALDEIKNS